MKYTKILLIVFFLSLFVFQQVQAGATIPHTENPSQINLAPANTKTLFDNVYVDVYKLEFTGELVAGRVHCTWPLTEPTYGCGQNFANGFPKSPLEPEGFLNVSVEQYYLPDVLATEMDTVDIPPVLAALKAQAVASRTHASWKSFWSPDRIVTRTNANGTVATFNVINNSTDYQAFIPGAYDISSSDIQSKVYQAVSGTTNQYLSPNDVNTIDAEFGSEAGSQTEPEPGKGYMITVSEPNFSAACGTTRNYSGKGMSQRGAIRWALGKVCPDGTGAV